MWLPMALRRRGRAYLRTLPPPPAPLGSDRIGAAIAEVIAQRVWPEFDPWALPVVVACRRLLADTVAQLPLVAYRGRRPMAVQPELVRRPNPLEPRWLTWHRAVNQLTRYGHCWLRVTDHDTAGRVAGIRVVDAADGAPTWDPETGDLDTVWINGDELVPGLDVMWVPYNVERRSSTGESPLEGCWPAVEDLARLWRMAGSFWETGYPSIALTVAHRLQPAQAAELKGQFIASLGGRHAPAVLDNDAKLETIGASALEAQLVESLAAGNAELARAFLMPPSLVNVASGDSLTYATTEGEFRRWLATGLGAYLTRLEAAVDDLSPPGQTNRFDTSALLRSDFQARADAYATALAGGAWLTPDEVRDREGLDPLDPATARGPVGGAALADPTEAGT